MSSFHLFLELVALSFNLSQLLVPKDLLVWRPRQRSWILLHLLKDFSIILLECFRLLSWNDMRQVLLDVATGARPSRGLQAYSIIHALNCNSS